MRILVVQWDYPAARQRAAELREAGHDVAIESNDPGAAYRKARTDLPDVIVLDLAYRPSLTRHATRALSRLFGNRLIFVGGAEHQRDRAGRQAPAAVFTPAARLVETLEEYEPPPYVEH